MKHPFLRIVCALAVTVTLAACGSSSSSGAGHGTSSAASPSSTSKGQKSAPSASPSPASAASSETSTPPSKSLVLYEAAGFANAVATAFEQKTGIKVNVVHLPTGPLAAKIEAEGNYPQWDVAWFDGGVTMRSIANLGLLSTGWTPNDIGNYTAGGNAMIPSDHAYFPLGYTAAGAIAYNTKAVPANEAPKTWQDLAKPAFKNAVAMNNPAISGPTYPFVAGILQQMGTSNGEQFFQTLKANGLQVYAKNGPTIRALLSGKAKVVVAQDAALIGFQLKGAPIKMVYPASGVFKLENVVAIAKNAPDKQAAEAFIQFCLTPQAQAIMSNPKDGGSDSYRTSVIKSVAAPQPVQVRTGHVKWVNVDQIQGARQESAVLKWFTQKIVK